MNCEPVLSGIRSACVLSGKYSGKVNQLKPSVTLEHESCVLCLLLITSIKLGVLITVLAATFVMESTASLVCPHGIAVGAA